MPALLAFGKPHLAAGLCSRRGVWRCRSYVPDKRDIKHRHANKPVPVNSMLFVGHVGPTLYLDP